MEGRKERREGSNCSSAHSLPRLSQQLRLGRADRAEARAIVPMQASYVAAGGFGRNRAARTGTSARMSCRCCSLALCHKANPDNVNFYYALPRF